LTSELDPEQKSKSAFSSMTHISTPAAARPSSARFRCGGHGSNFLLAAILLLIGAATLAAGEVIPYRLLIGDSQNGKIFIREKDGTISWEHSLEGRSFDGSKLANGNVLFTFQGGRCGVVEVTPDHKEVFRYVVKGPEVHTVQRLPDGLTLLDDVANTRLIEVDAQGQIKRELKLNTKSHFHHMTRLARKQPDGTYLVAQDGDGAIVEYKADGTEARRIPMNSNAHLATRLPSGNLLIATGNGAGVVELDAKDKPVWDFTRSNFPADANPTWTVGDQRLANGNTLIVNWLGSKNGKGVSVMESTPDKKVVWALREMRTVFYVQILE
jgi:hypothetical protein